MTAPVDDTQLSEAQEKVVAAIKILIGLLDHPDPRIAMRVAEYILETGWIRDSAS